MTLRKYKEKRSFENTPEPKGSKSKGAVAFPAFCVQKHAASHLHYDFRLEHKGVLLSWAVPKGPSLDPADKRLAVHVEDHPLEYRHFEGVIPKGNYGAGTVEIWDEGKFATPDAANKKDVEKAIDVGLKKGHLTFILLGKKLKGSFNLVRLKDDKNWLLIKGKDGDA
jgi:bifunctional non-homologous end joining protein LigD